MKIQLQYARRAAQIIRVSFRNLGAVLYDRIRGRSRIPGPERARLMFEELSGSLLKFGQILSLQVDTLPQAYCDALLSLLDRVPPFSAAEVKRVFTEEFGKAPEVLYREFDYRPLASASIGQVHRAVLQDGKQVAVKVQRPDAREVFLRDAALLRLFIRIVFLFRIRTLYFMRDPVREFTEWVLDELDYRREAGYAEILGRNARENPSEKVPAVYWELITGRVLTIDFLEGYSVMEYMRILDTGDEQKLAELKALGFDPAQFLSNVITNFLSDTYRHGVFHADLHPANLLIMKNNVVGYVDFGIVGSLTPEARRKQIQLNLAYVRGKTDEIFSAFVSVCTFAGRTNLPGFRRGLERYSHTWYREPAVGGVPHFSRSLTTAMLDLLTLCRSHGLLVDREMIKYIRSLILVDGLVTRLAPGLDLAPHIRRVCEDFLAREARVKMASPSAVLTFLADLSGWLLAGPGRMLQAIDLLERRQVRVQTRSVREPSAAEGMRIRALWLASIWVVLAVVVLECRENLSVNAATFAITGLWAFWTVWLLGLLRKLHRS